MEVLCVIWALTVHISIQNTNFTFGPSGENVAQVENLKGRIVFGDGDRPTSAESAKTFFHSPKSPFLEVLGIFHVGEREPSTIYDPQ